MRVGPVNIIQHLLLDKVSSGELLVYGVAMNERNNTSIGVLSKIQTWIYYSPLKLLFK
jgi:hypothetical protein